MAATANITTSIQRPGMAETVNQVVAILRSQRPFIHSSERCAIRIFIGHCRSSTRKPIGQTSPGRRFKTKTKKKIAFKVQ